MMKKLGIYIHIPFCIKKCAYCDFLSFDDKGELKDAYVDALIHEIGAFYASGFLVDSIYIGGGTPTILSIGQLERILNAVAKRFNIDNKAEISIESNPKTVKHYRRLKEIGFNRLSIGLQSANDDELALLGRVHTFSDFVKSYEEAAASFSNINIDIMFSLPNQTIYKWEKTLTKTRALNPAHISCYSLKIEKGTPFEKMELLLPDEETDRNMYYMAKEMLKGYKRYEISNFAKEGMNSKHNLKYWKRMPYVGFGLGAHSYMGSIRSKNKTNIIEYINSADKKQEQTHLSEQDAMSEFMFLRLRLSEGINKNEFKMQFKKDIEEVFAEPISKHIQLGTMAYKNENYYLTDYGIDISNSVLCDFL